MATYFTLLTPAGLAKVANAQLTNEKIEISHVAVGDANGTPYQPLGTETVLKNEVWRGGIASIEIDSQNPNWIVVEGVIPASAGGFTIREVGLFDTDGAMIAVGNYPDTYKPVIADGSTMDLALRTIIEVNNASSVTLRVDPNVIVASRAYVDNKTNDFTHHLLDYEYQTPIIVGTQLQLVKRSNTKRLLIKLENTVNGQITISLNGGTTSKPLINVAGQPVNSIDKGFSEVVEDTSFFILRSSGISAADLQALIDIVNEAERNESDLRTQFINEINEVDTFGGINLPSNATWSDVLTQVPNINTGNKMASGTLNFSTTGQVPFVNASGTTVNTNVLQISGLDFLPSTIMAWYNVGGEANNLFSVTTNFVNPDGYSIVRTANTSTIRDVRLTGNAYIRLGEFSMPLIVNTANNLFWIAYE